MYDQNNDGNDKFILFEGSTTQYNKSLLSISTRLTTQNTQVYNDLLGKQ